VLTIIVPMSESFDESDNTFTVEGFPLELEHSLAALSKWESIVEKPFLAPGEKSTEEVMEYIKAMIVTPDFPPEVLQNLSKQNIADINAYIDAKQTATWFSETKPETKSQEIITAEVIYYWLTTFQIPWEAQYWHLNRLFTLIKVFDLKQSKPKKMGRSELAARNRELNAQRKREMGTRG
jgi:hypothetical protein